MNENRPVNSKHSAEADAHDYTVREPESTEQHEVIEKQGPTSRRIVPFVLAVLGVIFIAVGILRGEPAVVLQKATHICLECIGIG